MHKPIFEKNGFTIIELIIASAISITSLGVGFFVLQIALKGNKIEESQIGLSGKLNDTLDFILDEVKVGKRLIYDEIKVTSINENCKYPDSGEFLFGIRLPDQALVKDSYNPEGGRFNLNQIECPIVYTIRPSKDNEMMPYSLVRYGPQYNEKGFYISPSYQEFQESVLLDGITSKEKDKTCPENWDGKNIKGISFCIDENEKYIEIEIVSEASNLNSADKKLTSLASTGGFSLIQDETQVNLIPGSFGSNNNSPNCIGMSCCWMGVCLKSNKITYMIDSSYFMHEEYKEHPNGVIINGKWEEIKYPDTISADINGKSLFKYVISSLKQHIRKLPTSNMASEGKKVYLQIISFNSDSDYLFRNGPKVLTMENKVEALSHLDKLSVEHDDMRIDVIEPWKDICSALKSDSVGQIILLSASIPLTTEGYCVNDIKGNYAEMINDYNMLTRSKTASGSLIIDSISLFHNFCESSKNYDNNNWLGLISGGDESICTHIK